MTQTADPAALEHLLRSVVSGWELELSDRQIGQLATHFSLLLQWNRKINLTSLRRPEEIATRHFGESLFLKKILPLKEGLLVDVGSGAGFPGLPLKVVSPSLAAVLLEPNQKKTAFLKEVARKSGLEGVEVRAERLKEVVMGGAAGASQALTSSSYPASLQGRASFVTMRAVAANKELIQGLKKILIPGGRLALFLSQEDAARLTNAPGIAWDLPVAIPDSERRVILVGQI